MSDGAPVALFDGASIELWSSVGAWTVERDEEGTGILTGSGEIRRSFSSEADYRLILGLDPYEAAYAEVQFAVPAGSGNAPRLLLRVSKDGGATLRRRDGERGTFRSVGNVVPYPSENWLKSRRPYLEVRVERANGEWAVWFNGTPVGRVADDSVLKTDEFRLLAADGAVRIDTVMVERIRPARP